MAHVVLFSPFPLPRMVTLSDNDLFYFGEAWLGTHAGGRQAVTGPVFAVLSMFMRRSDVDAKRERQTVYLGVGLKPGQPCCSVWNINGPR